MNKCLYLDKVDGIEKAIYITDYGCIMAHVNKKTYWGGHSAGTRCGCKDIGEGKAWIEEWIKIDMEIETKMKYLDKCSKEYDELERT